MIFSTKNTLFFAFFGYMLLSMPYSIQAQIKAVFWSKPDLFYQNRISMFKSLGFWNSLFNVTRASEVQNELFGKLTQSFGAQTQQYKANDPETNKPLPLIMRQWLTGEKSAHDIKHESRKIFKKDKFIVSITDIVFTPEELVSVTSVIEHSLKLVKKINQKTIKQILASNYDPASYEELKKSESGKRVLHHFKHIYNSGSLKGQYQGLVLQDPAFFALIMREQHLAPSECLVISSDPEVIKAAQANGMNILYHPFKDIQAIERQLKELNLIN